MGSIIKDSRRIVSQASTGGGGGSVNSVNSGTDITVDNTDPANPIVNFTGTYQDPITVVANYSALPAVGTVTGQFYWCSASQGTKWLPGALGGTYYSAGMYYSNGVSWEFLDVPYNATQAEVNTGTNTDKFVTPATLSAATTVISSTGTTGDIVSFSAANTPSRIAAVATGYLLGSQGTSTLPAWLQAATLNTSLTTPLLIGGTTTTSPLTLRSTSGVGTTGADIIFQTGNNGATEAARFLNSGALIINRSSSLFSLGQLEVHNNVNGANYTIFNNTSTGTGAVSAFILNNSATLSSYCGLFLTGSGYTTSGMLVQDCGILRSSAIAGLNIGTPIATQVSIWTNNVKRVSFSSTGLCTWTTAYNVLAAGTATASTAPLKFTSGTSLTSAEAGAMEFTTDDLFFTITTGAARKRLLMADDVGGLTSGRVPFATTNGRLTDDADMTFATDTLTVTKIVGSTSIKAGSVAGYLSSDGSAGATGSFTTTDLKTVTVKDGIITAIV